MCGQNNTCIIEVIMRQDRQKNESCKTWKEKKRNLVLRLLFRKDDKANSDLFGLLKEQSESWLGLFVILGFGLFWRTAQISTNWSRQRSEEVQLVDTDPH